MTAEKLKGDFGAPVQGSAWGAFLASSSYSPCKDPNPLSFNADKAQIYIQKAQEYTADNADMTQDTPGAAEQPRAQQDLHVLRGDAGAHA